MSGDIDKAWEVTDEVLDAYWFHPDTDNGIGKESARRALKAAVAIVRPRVEAATTIKPSPQPAYLQIGDLVVPTARVYKVKRYPSGVVVRVDADSFDVFAAEADALWSYLTDPSRCVDLTPDKATTGLEKVAKPPVGYGATPVDRDALDHIARMYPHNT